MVNLRNAEKWQVKLGNNKRDIKTTNKYKLCSELKRIYNKLQFFVFLCPQPAKKGSDINGNT